jgi:hypothetical protein
MISARRSQQFASDAAIRNALRQPWSGVVERRDPASYERPSVVMIRMCQNPACRHWTPTRLRCCVACHTYPEGTE